MPNLAQDKNYRVAPYVDPSGIGSSGNVDANGNQISILADATNPATQRQGVNAVGQALVNTEGQKVTYSTAITALALAASATDVFTLKGSATKTIRVNQIRVSAIATAAAVADLQLAVRSTADTAGTQTAPALVPHDSADAAATAVANAYTANPTLGTLVGYVRSDKLMIGKADGTAVPFVLVFTFGERNSRALVLRGVAQQLCLNLNGVTYSGGLLDVTIEFTEE